MTAVAMILMTEVTSLAATVNSTNSDVYFQPSQSAYSTLDSR